MTMPAIGGGDQSSAAFWFALCSDEGKRSVLKEVGVILAERYHVYRQQLKDAVGLANKPPAERLADYQGRSGQVWRLLSAVWPNTYAAQTEDWQKLETQQRERLLARGELARSPQLAASPISTNTGAG